MPAKTRVFVETSIQIARVLAEPKQQEAIAAQLQQADHEFVTSHYVFAPNSRQLQVISVRTLTPLKISHAWNNCFTRCKTIPEML